MCIPSKEEIQHKEKAGRMDVREKKLEDNCVKTIKEEGGYKHKTAQYRNAATDQRDFEHRVN